jgi:hypothetical protein
MGNILIGLAPFVKEWEKRPNIIIGDDSATSGSDGSMTDSSLKIVSGKNGQINIDGTAASPSMTLPRSHPSFISSLETGVKDLVVLLNDTFDCITYSSCEGHGDGDILLRGRNVDILPRDREEMGYLSSALGDIIEGARLPNESVDLVLRREILTSEIGDHDALDLNFLPLTRSAKAYFDAVGPIYDRLLSAIRSDGRR